MFHEIDKIGAGVGQRQWKSSSSLLEGLSVFSFPSTVGLFDCVFMSILKIIVVQSNRPPEEFLHCVFVCLCVCVIELLIPLTHVHVCVCVCVCLCVCVTEYTDINGHIWHIGGSTHWEVQCTWECHQIPRESADDTVLVDRGWQLSEICPTDSSVHRVTTDRQIFRVLYSIVSGVTLSSVSTAFAQSEKSFHLYAHLTVDDQFFRCCSVTKWIQ
jgi:hypothetical protein